MEPKGYTVEGASRRGRALILAAVIGLAVIGYVVGLRAGVPEGHARAFAGVRQTHDVQGAGIPALTYTEVGEGALRARTPGETWGAMTADLRAARSDPVTDLVSRERSLAVRAERRAFNGAPPVVPHAVQRMTDQSCLVCHGQALQVGARPARALPHAHLTNCTQCHAAAAPQFFQGEGGMLSESSWRGIAAPLSGVRATPGAPPAVPHALQMRQNCLACHGQQGWVGMQTSHPDRRNCLQCHAPTDDRSHPGRTVGDSGMLPPLKVDPR
jgi:cytochrome c-type protein NapB